MPSSRSNKDRLYVCIYSHTRTVDKFDPHNAAKVGRDWLGSSAEARDRRERTDGLIFELRKERRSVAKAAEVVTEQLGESAATRTRSNALRPGDPTWKWTIAEQHVHPVLTTDYQPHLLARFAVGKVNSKALMRNAIMETLVNGVEAPGFDDMIWVRDALVNVACMPRAMGTGVRDWETIKTRCMWYMNLKATQHRWDGGGRFDQTKIPTWDLMLDEELIG